MIDLEISLFCKQTGPKYVNKWLKQISLPFLYSPWIVETPELCYKKWPDFYLKLSRSISVYYVVFYISFRQYYTYIVDKRCKRLGSQAWVFVCIAVSELILNIKFGKDLFSNTQYKKIIAWFFVIALTSLLGILASMKYYRYRYPVEVTEETTSVENSKDHRD